MATVRVSQSNLRRAVSDTAGWEPDVATIDVTGAARVRADHLIAYLKDAGLSAMSGEVELSDECEEDLPYAAMWVRRTSEGAILQVCAHAPEHVTVLVPAP